MEGFTIHKLGIYPLSKYYIEQLEMPSVFESYMPKVKGSLILSECLSILVQNIVVSPKPLYEISDWLKSYADGQGEFGYSSKKFTDDRLGEALDALYEYHRQSIMTQISSKAIAVHKLDVSKVHNDSTTITLQGAYDNQEEEGIQLKRGYNKDHRPDCKQIVFGLNVIGDGQVPISMNLHDGNITDDQTHAANWNELRSFLGKTDFCYIADSKAATKEKMMHIDTNKGKFISLLPATRTETKTFKKRLRDKPKEVTWSNPQVYPNSRKVDEPTTYRFFEEEQTVDSFR
jgi:transposase